MYENYLDSRSHSFGTSSTSRTVLPRRSSHTVLPAPFFPLRSSPPFFPAPYFPTVLPAPFPSLCHKNRIRYILHCVLVYATRQNCSRDTHRDATGDVFIAILLTVISFDPSYDPSSEPSCEPSCNPSCGTARASFQPLSINRIAADNSVGRGWAAEHAQFCFRHLLRSFLKNNLPLESTRNSWVNTEGEIRPKSRP